MARSIRFASAALRRVCGAPAARPMNRPVRKLPLLVDSKNWTFLARCCPNTPTRKIARSVHEAARDVARAIAKTDAYKQSRKDRKKVEMLFAHLKGILKLDRLRLRGPSGAHDEFLLAATAQNLRRRAMWWCPAEPETARMAM